MSWSYSYKGPLQGAADHISDAFNALTVSVEPEASVAHSVEVILLSALDNWDPSHDIVINAHGSQWKRDDDKQTNTLYVSIGIPTT